MHQGRCKYNYFAQIAPALIITAKLEQITIVTK